MYNQELVLTVDTVTVIAGGDDENKVHGIALKLLGTATSKEEFADLGYGTGAKYVDALLNGDLPVQGTVELRVSERDDVKLKFIDHEMKGLVIPVTIRSIRLFPRQGASWRFEIKTKSYSLKPEAAGLLTNTQRTMQHCHLMSTQMEAIKETFTFSPVPQDATKKEEKKKDPAQQDLDLKQQAPPPAAAPAAKTSPRKRTRKRTRSAKQPFQK